ncbi:MAG: NUDIX domain-containing protein [Aristaeellaceae bacterium]
MNRHFGAYSAVFPVFLRTRDGRRQVLLHRRLNTGYMDGLWDIAGSGHVDAGETAMQALIREAMEELGVVLHPEDVAFAHLSHRLGSRTYYDIYFLVHSWIGTPEIREPEKCSDLAWFDVNALPEDMIDIRRTDLLHCLRGEAYSEKRPEGGNV